MRIAFTSSLLLVAALSVTACSKPPVPEDAAAPPKVPAPSGSPAVSPAPPAATQASGDRISVPVSSEPAGVISTSTGILTGGDPPDVIGFQETASEMIFSHSEKVRGLTMVANLINDSEYQTIVDEYAAKVEMTRAKIDELDLVDGDKAQPLMIEIRQLMADITAIDTRATERLKQIRK